MTIGFIGQGFIGKNYADDFEARGLSVVRYSLEEPHVQNKEALPSCDLVFIAVPTPTTPAGFDASILRSVLPLVGKGKVAIIKSTTLPGTVAALQTEFPDIFILHSPEFLAEKTAAYDAAHPMRNIIGIPRDTPEYRAHAETILGLLPKAPFSKVVHSNESELIKYAGNSFLFFKIMFANLFYDLAHALDADYEVVRAALGADPRIGPSHLGVIDESGHLGATPGRGAGGHCLIKDFAALRALFETLHPEDGAGLEILHALELKNIELLLSTNKDSDIVAGVYGPNTGV